MDLKVKMENLKLKVSRRKKVTNKSSFKTEIDSRNELRNIYKINCQNISDKILKRYFLKKSQPFEDCLLWKISVYYDIFQGCTDLKVIFNKFEIEI